MCGICGFYSKSSLKFDSAIKKMCAAISHRGPDDNGSWQDENLGIVLGHQRLSIIDLSAAGHQPMQSSSGRFILSYNGEIYNHLALRTELKDINSNIKWRGNSDTETLLEGLEFWGIEETLKKLVGMFAFILWDKKLHCLTLVRDRMGEKPLYYGWQGKGDNSVFLFGSELKALKVHPNFRAEINRDAITLQFRHNCIPAPYSIYKDIYKLLPGHYLQLNEKLLTISVKQQMISDVPLGAFLSGGVDSSTIVALMQTQSSRPIKTFTIGFNEEDYNEAKYAKEASRHLGTEHNELYVSAEQAMAVIPKLQSIYDEPFSDSSQIPTFLVSQLAKQYVTVSLSGDGGDELFCGYNRYIISKNFFNKLNLMPYFFKKILSLGIKSVTPKNWVRFSKIFPQLRQLNNFGDKMHKGATVLGSKNFSELHYRLASHFENPNEIVINSKEPSTFFTNFKPTLPGLDDQQQMMALDCITYLPDDILVKLDRAAMATSLETRTPFLNHKLIEYAWRIPQSLKLKNGISKWILREILKKYLPEKLIDRKKTGFGIPIDLWLRGPLRDWAESLLNKTRLDREGYLNSDKVLIKWKEHLSGKMNWQYHLWDVLMFQAWLEKNKN
jgi:asparagine synthase (glutamine-hydrolysing)